MEVTLNKAFKDLLYKQVLEIIQYICEHHVRILSCEIEWVKAEHNDELYLVDIRNIVYSKHMNRPFTNTLYRHLKRNL